MFHILRPYLARLASAIAVGFATWLGAKLGFEVLPEHTDAISGFIVFLLFAAYSLVHKAISSKTNPVDAASTDVAERTKVEEVRRGN